MAVEYLVILRRYAPFETFGGGFEGDNRQFSTNLSVTARTVGMVAFSPSGVDGDTKLGYSSGSAYLGPWAVRRSHKIGAIGKHIGQVQINITGESHGDNTIAFTLETSGNLPLKDILLPKSIASTIDRAIAGLRPDSPHPQGTPNIDTFLDFKATIYQDHIDVEGTMRGDSFPNAEVFLLDYKLYAAPLLDYQTSGGVGGPIRLLTSHPKVKRAQFQKQVPLQSDGSFGSATGFPVIVKEK